MIDIDNFDFLPGKWKILNKRLKDRLDENSLWYEFDAKMETIEILKGNGSIDEFRTDYFEKDFVGFSLRLYNPSKNEWTIYWSDTYHLDSGLKKQVVGSFKNGEGIFYGDELFNDKLYELRFKWTRVSEEVAQWEQAYRMQDSRDWLTNWIMIFTRESND